MDRRRGACEPVGQTGPWEQMSNIKRWIVPALVFLAVSLATPSLCHAHALHPGYYPLGPHPFVFPLTTPTWLLSVIVVVGIQAAILRYMVSNRKPSGNLWRAGVAFLVSKAAESIPGCAILWAAPWVMWSDDSSWAVFWAPLLLFGVGFVANVVLVWLFFRKQRPSKVRILATAGLLSVTSYVVLLSSTLGMLQVGWME